MLKVIDGLSVVFNCFCNNPRVKQDDQRRKRGSFERNIYDLGEKYNICVLPIQQTFELDNLYPQTNQVHDWTTLVVGKDKTYVLTHLGSISFANSEQLVNNKGPGIIPKELQDFFDPLWDETLAGTNLQLFLVIDGLTYFMNTFSFKNNRGVVIGACMFLRLFNTIPNVFKNAKKPIP